MHFKDKGKSEMSTVKLSKEGFKPYYAVIFTNKIKGEDLEYEQTAQRMVELAEKQSGYLGIESTRNEEGIGITVSYWESLDAIRNWKLQSEHLEAQANGKKSWYSQYTVRVAHILYEYDFEALD